MKCFTPKKGDIINFTTNTQGLFEIVVPVMAEDELFDANLLEQTIEGLISQGKRNFALDLSKIEYIYSDSINKFINLNHKILNVYGRLALLAPQPEVMQILQRAGIQNFITIYSSLDEIIQASEQMIQQTSAISTADVQNYMQSQQAAPQQNEFDDLRSEIGNVMEMDDSSAPDVGIQDSSFAAPVQPAQPAQPQFQQQTPQYQQPITQQVPTQPVQPQAAPVPQPEPMSQPETPFQPATTSAAPLPDFDNVDDTFEEEDRFENEKKSSGLPVAAIILLVISVLAIAGVGGFIFLNSSKSKTPKTVKKIETPQVSKDIPEIPDVPEIDEEPVKPVKTTPTKTTVTKRPTPKTTTTRRSTPKTTTKPVVKTNSIVITSSPSGSKVVFNKKVLGTTPYTWNNPSAYGMISVAVEKDGYETKNMNFEYTGGTDKKHFALVQKKAETNTAPTKPASTTPASTTPASTTPASTTPASTTPASTTPAATTPVKTTAPTKPAGEPGTIFISSLPPMADVYMDGAKIGKTNIAELKITAGEHTMRFVKGAKETTKKMTFKPGKNPSQLIRLK